VVGSVLLGVMVLFILVSQKQFEMLLYKMMPRSAIHKLRRYQSTCLLVQKYLLTGTADCGKRVPFGFRKSIFCFENSVPRPILLFSRTVHYSRKSEF